MAEKILLVEDEEKMARMLELELQHEGYTVEKAFDGLTGLERAEKGGPDLVLLDVMLPGMSGMEVLRRLRRTSSVPVILLTARDAVTDKVSGLDSGADDYITKPFAIEELLARLRRLIEEAKKADVVLLHENEKDIYGDTDDRCLDLMKELYCDNFKAVFDFANFVQCGVDTLRAYELMKPYVVYIHIKDAEAGTGTIVPPGKGAGHLAEILAKFKADGYTGFISLEPHLTNFTGLSGLEKEVEERHTTLTGEEAFTLAHDCLVEILDKI